MKRFPISKLIVAAFAFTAIGAASAQQDLTADQVKAKLEAAGYTNVQDIHREGKHFDAKAMKDGKQMSLDVNAKTGAITAEKKKGKDEKHKNPY